MMRVDVATQYGSLETYWFSDDADKRFDEDTLIFSDLDQTLLVQLPNMVTIHVRRNQELIEDQGPSRPTLRPVA